MRYFIERFQGTPEGSQSTREATLSGAMRGILRSGRRGALKTGSDMALQRQQDLLGTAVSKDLYVSDPDEEE